MTQIIPMAAIIPTYNRGLAVLRVLEKIHECDPKPSEIWVHIDLADGALENELSRRFPDVRVLTSTLRLGPGGGRHRCLEACTTPYAVSFDDDSYPVDTDFFAKVQELFLLHPRVAIFGARIWHRREPERILSENLILVPSYIGCGYAVRLEAYRGVRGYLPKPVSYGIEESDLSLQLFANGWRIAEAGSLRVFHDTELTHHQSAEITSGSIANVALCAFLHYPAIGLGWGSVQLANKVAYCIRMGRMHGIMSGLLSIPIDCFRYRQYRNPIPWRILWKFLNFRRAGIAPL